MTDRTKRGVDASRLPALDALVTASNGAGSEYLDQIEHMIDLHVTATRRLVVSGPSGHQAMAEALTAALDENSRLRESLRLSTMQTLRTQWSGLDPDPAQSANLLVTLDGQSTTLRTAEELLRYWARSQSPTNRYSVPALWAHWMQICPALTPIANPSSTEALAASRTHAAQMRDQSRNDHGTPGSLDRRWAELLEVKSIAVQIAGGTSTLARGLLAREGLDAFDLTQDGIGELAAAAADSQPLHALSQPLTASTVARFVPVHEVLATLPMLPVHTHNWQDFSATLINTCRIDWMARPAKRSTSCCLPFKGGRSHIITSFDGSPSSVLSLLHELGHAYLYWRIGDTPELLRPRRGVDEMIALCVELDLTTAWIRTHPETAVAFAEAASHRWLSLFVGSAHRLRAELSLLQLCTADAGPKQVLLTEQDVRTLFSTEDIAFNTQLIDSELQSARYLIGAAAAITWCEATVTFDLVGALASVGHPPPELKALVDEACRVSTAPGYTSRLAALWNH